MSSSENLPRQLRLILAVTIVHVVAWFAYYNQIPAGQYPSDETRATLHTAQAIASGLPTDASGHSLYTYTLSVLARFFESSESLTKAARALNAIALIFATGFTASAAGHYWRRNRTVWIAGLFVGLNPILVFWAAEISPSLLATVCMSVALWRVLPWLRHPRTRDSLAVSISLVLAAAFETSLLPFALFWPVLAYIHPQHKRTRHFTLALIPPALIGGLVLVSSLQLQAPLLWNLDQIGHGVYQALGGPESYDGKSFDLYRQLHLILFLNPIHWGALFILAGMGMYARLKDGHRQRSILLAIGTLAVFAISYALNESGHQARVSLIPLLAVFAAGVALFPKIWHHASKRTRRKILALGIVLSLFTYAGHFTQNQSEKWERDYIYLAKANIELGYNDRAATWAQKALDISPDRDDMKTVLVLAQFNDWATSNRQRTLPIEITKTYLEATQALGDTVTPQTIHAIYQYKLREIETAQKIWQAQREQSALALFCLYWTGIIAELTPEEIEAHAGQPYYDLLQAATEMDRNALNYSNTEKQLDNILAFAY
ncbi:hypothetical protein ACWPKS_01875 [Coraliomargarita sp. W4R72]